MKDVVIVAACRTPIGKTAGSLSQVQDTSLMALTFKEAIRRLGRRGNIIDGVYVGCCFPSENYNLARKALLEAGLPDSVPGATINRTCCSSMEALIQGVRQIMSGDGEVIMIGGVENMSKSPYVMKNAIKNARALIAGKIPSLDELDASLINEIGISVEVLARKSYINKKLQDEAAYSSRLKAYQAENKGYFNDEIFPVYDGENLLLDKDEELKGDFSLPDFSDKPIFARDGTITKYNSTSINDGASAVILMSKKRAEREGLEPLAHFVTSETIGISPEDMAIAPAKVINRILDKERLEMKDIGLIECNEAFAAQLIACKQLLNWDEDRVNISGGSIALGHPLGSTGLRICITLIYNMKRYGRTLGLAALCAGGGMGQGVLLKR